MFQSQCIGAGGTVRKSQILKSSIFTVETLYIYAANVLRHYRHVVSLIQGLAGNEIVTAISKVLEIILVLKIYLRFVFRSIRSLSQSVIGYFDIGAMYLYRRLSTVLTHLVTYFII